MSAFGFCFRLFVVFALLFGVPWAWFQQILVCPAEAMVVALCLRSCTKAGGSRFGPPELGEGEPPLGHAGVVRALSVESIAHPLWDVPPTPAPPPLCG